MHNDFSYEELIKRVGFKFKPKQVANIITCAVAVIGTIALLVGLIFAYADPNASRPWGLIIAVAGLLLIIFSEPLHQFVLGRLIKKRIDMLIKLLENEK